MGIERIPEGHKDAPPAGEVSFTGEQMTTVVGERDSYRAALYEATNARLTDVDKVADALGKIDTLHRELHTLCKERDQARQELKDADRLLDSPLRTISFGAGGLAELARGRVKAHRRTRGTYSRYEPRRKKFR
jgi:hypothetical protein